VSPASVQADQRVSSRPGLSRQLGLLGLVATGICSMVGAAINVIPFSIQRSVPGIGPFVLPAYLFAAIPAILSGLAYAILASAMPRAGGSYVYASRALSPYLGFVASFSQWFGLCVAIGVVSYVLIPFLRDVATGMGLAGVATALDTGSIRLLLALGILWLFVGVNLRGLRFYQRTLVPLMFLTFAGGLIVIVTGFAFDHADFAAALPLRNPDAVFLPPVTYSVPPGDFQLRSFLVASVLLFSSFIGFDSIAQAGGEARNPARSLPLAIAISVVTVGAFYMLFTAAVYHAIPWAFVAREAMTHDVTAPGLLGYLLSPGWTVAIVGGAAIALAKDLPAMIYAVSRLMFAWAEDGIFPAAVARIHPVRHTPNVAIVASGVMASLGILGSHLARDFFLGVDVLVTAMLVNFLLICISVLTLPRRNPALAGQVQVVRSRTMQVPLALLGVLATGGFLAVHTWRDLSTGGTPWYLRSTPVWIAVMLVGTAIYLREKRKLVRSGVDVAARFASLPPEQ
jgi:amino acid transporter